ncbi:MAG: lipopolysaccharide biosynthesis protein [Anaerolineales bacterium]
MKDQILRLGRKAAIYGVGSILNRAISFLLLPLFTKYLTPADYGVSSILGWMTFLLTPIFSLGIGAGIATCYYEREGSSQKEGTIWSAVSILLVSAVTLVIIGVPFASQWSRFAFQTPDYRTLVTITFFSTALSILSTPFMMYLQFEERARLYAAITVITTFVSIGTNILLVVVFRRGVEGLIEGFFVTQIVNLLLFAFPAIVNLRYRFDFGIGKELLRLGVPLIPSFAFLFILQQGNRYILQMSGGLEQVGIYTIGYNFGAVMSVPVDALVVAWFPYFMSFSERREEARSLFGRIVTFYLMGFGSLSLLFYIFAKPVVMLMTQPAFHEAYQTVGLSATSFFLSGLYYLLLPGMYFAKDVKHQSWIQGAAALIGSALSVLLIWKFNILGAGLGLAAGFLLVVILTFYWNSRRKVEYFQAHYEWKRILTYSLFYVVYILLIQWNRDYSLITEGFVSLAFLIPLPFALYAMLNAWERQNLMAMLKRSQQTLFQRFSNSNS